MRRFLHLMLIMLLLTPIEFSLISSASAAKTGSRCTKLNAESTDGINPLICQKNTKGKFVWVINKQKLEDSKQKRLDALNSLIALHSDVAILEKSLIVLQKAYFENLCKGGGYLVAADIYKISIEKQESIIGVIITGAELILINYPDLKSYAPSQVPKTIFGECPSNTIQKISSPTPTPKPTPKPTPASTPQDYSLSLSVTVLNAIVAIDGDFGIRVCNNGGAKYPDIYENTGVEIRDGNGSLLATGPLGSSTVILNSPWGSHCVFKPTIRLKKSDFYQIKIGTRYNVSFSFDDLVREKWKIVLSIGK